MTPMSKKFYRVVAKCGHVGKRNYVPVAFAVIAESKSEASQKVMHYRRVKKHLKDAIITCEEINKREYKSLKKANFDNQYLQCKCNKDRMLIENFANLVCRNELKKIKKKIEPAKSMKYKNFLYELGGRKNIQTLCYGEY